MKDNLTITLPKGIELHTIVSDENYRMDAPHYVSYLERDIELYRKEFPKEIHELYGDIPIYDVVTETTKNIHIPHEAASLAIFACVLVDSKVTMAQLKAVLDIFYSSLKECDHPLNGREQMVLNLLRKTFSPHHSIKDFYDSFVVSMELDDPLFHQPYKEFAKLLKKHGYSGIIDIADIRYNTYQAEQPLIILDTSCIRVKDIRQINK